MPPQEVPSTCTPSPGESSVDETSSIQSEVKRVRKRLQKLIDSVPEEKLGAHAQEHHVAVDKLLFIPSREEVGTWLSFNNFIVSFNSYWEELG